MTHERKTLSQNIEKSTTVQRGNTQSAGEAIAGNFRVPVGTGLKHSAVLGSFRRGSAHLHFTYTAERLGYSWKYSTSDVVHTVSKLFYDSTN